MQTGVRGEGEPPPLHYDRKKLASDASATSFLKTIFFLISKNGKWNPSKCLSNNCSSFKNVQYVAWCSIFGNE
jgi:hypothetical protein